MSLKKPFNKRFEEYQGLQKKYPDRIPVIISSDDIFLKKTKYLVPKELTVGQFMFVLRKHIQVSQEKALFIMINNTAVPLTKLLELVYNEHKNEDGFLYVNICSESFFG